MKPQHANRAPAHPERVNVYEPWEELYWGDRLRCTTEQLRAAVDAAGPALADVRLHLEAVRRSNQPVLPHPGARRPMPSVRQPVPGTS